VRSSLELILVDISFFFCFYFLAIIVSVYGTIWYR